MPSSLWYLTPFVSVVSAIILGVKTNSEPYTFSVRFQLANQNGNLNTDEARAGRRVGTRSCSQIGPTLHAQWLHYPTAGYLETPGGKPNLTAPTLARPKIRGSGPHRW
jgi:hypothetical protein